VCLCVCGLPFCIKVEINTFTLQFQFCMGVREVHRLKKFENMVMGGDAVTDCAHTGG